MRIRTMLLLGVLAVTIAAAPAPAGEAHAAGPREYYVDSGAGDDGNAGSSPDSAWASLERVNAELYHPGDTILFRSGRSWVGQLSPRGSGAAGSPISVRSFGDGARPLIAGEGRVESTVHLFNQEYWDIGGLELTNQGASPATAPRRGVHVEGEDFGVEGKSQTDLDSVSTLSGIRLHDLHIHDVNGEDEKDAGGSAGIQVSVRIAGMNDQQEPAPGARHQRTRFDSVTIENNVIDRVSRSGIITWSDWKNRAELGDGIGYGSTRLTPFTPFTNVVIRGNTLSEIGGDGIVPHMTDGALVERNTVAGFNKTSAGHNVGMWTWDGDATLYQYNDVSGGFSTRDGNAFDFDHASRGVVYQYNYSHDNDGGALLFCADGRAGGIYDGVFQYNVSQNDRYKLFTICAGANLHNMTVRNNVFAVAPGMATTMLDAQGGENQVRLTNNIFFNRGSGGYASKPGWTYDSNVYFGNNVPPASFPDPGASTADPLFVAPGVATGVGDLGGYRLRSGSPSLGTGAATVEGGRDIWGALMAATAPNRGVYAGLGEAVDGRPGTDTP